MELPQQRQRVVVDGLGKIGEIKENNTVEKSIESGIIREREDKTPITKITDKSIDKVSNAKIQGYTDEQFKFIQQQHKELLKYARNNNENKEVAFVFRKDFTDRSVVLGDDKNIEFGSSLMGKGTDVFVMHNHPRNSSFSLTDIDFFSKTADVKTLSIIKNNGKVEVITKSDNCNISTFLFEYYRLYRKTVTLGTNKEKDMFVKALLSKTKSGVIWYEI